MIRNKIIATAFVLCLTLSIFIGMIDNAEAVESPELEYIHENTVDELQVFAEIGDSSGYSSTYISLFNIGDSPIKKVFIFMPKFLYDEDLGIDSSYDTTIIRCEFPYLSTTQNFNYFEHYNTNLNYIEFTFVDELLIGEMIPFAFHFGFNDISDYITTEVDFTGVISLYAQSTLLTNTAIYETTFRLQTYTGEYDYSHYYSDNINNKDHFNFPDISAGSTDIKTSNYLFVYRSDLQTSYMIGEIDFKLFNDCTNSLEPTGFKLNGNCKLIIKFQYLSEPDNYYEIDADGHIPTIIPPPNTDSIFIWLSINDIPIDTTADTFEINYVLRLSTNPVIVIGGGIGFPRPPPTPPNPTIGIGMRVLLGDENGIYGNINDYLNEFNVPTSGFPVQILPREPSIETTINQETNIISEEREHKLYLLITTYLVRWQFDNNNFEVQGYYLIPLTINNYFDAVDWVRTQSEIGADYLLTFFIQGIHIITLNHGVTGQTDFTFGGSIVIGEEDTEYYYSVPYANENYLVTIVSFPISVPHDNKMMDASECYYDITTTYVEPIPEVETGTSIDDYLYSIYSSEGRDSFWTFSIMMSLIIIVLLFTKRKNGKIFIR